MNSLMRLAACIGVTAMVMGPGMAGCVRHRSVMTEAALVERSKQLEEEYRATTKAALARLARRFRQHQADYAAGKVAEPATLNILTLSGGGDYGAFGAGYLKGWGKMADPKKRRPEFDVVIGVSTGALIAPFAFIGTDEEYARVADLYRNPRKDWIQDRGLLFFLPANESFAEIPGLERELREAIGAKQIERLAAGAGEGRMLVVNTTNLDYGKSRPWDVGLEAREAVRSGKYERVYQILLASAGIPAAFPSREIDGGLYVDGGVTANVLYGGALKRDSDFHALWTDECPGLPMPRVRYWVIMNNQVSTPPKTVGPQWPSVIGRSVETAIRASTVTSIRHLATMVELMKLRDGTDVDLKIVAIPDEWRAPKQGVFIKETMDDLVNLGERMGEAGEWMKECP